MKRLLLATFFSLFIIGCTSPTETEIEPVDNPEWCKVNTFNEPGCCGKDFHLDPDSPCHDLLEVDTTDILSQ